MIADFAAAAWARFRGPIVAVGALVATALLLRFVVVPKAKAEWAHLTKEWHDRGVMEERARWQVGQAQAGKTNAERVVERRTTNATEENNRALQAANDDLRARYDRLRAQKPAAVSGAPLCSATPGFPDATGCTFDEGARAGLLDLAERADGFAERLNAAVDWYDE